MRLDIYRRAEPDGKYSYLAVPENQLVPNEVVNTDWEVEIRALYVDDQDDRLTAYSIDHLGEQITEKGYAVTRLH
jgi:hypothetical protein